MDRYILKDLNQHCFDLSYFFYTMNHTSRDALFKPEIAEWLNLASGIQSVEFDSRPYNYAEASQQNIYGVLVDQSRNLNSQIVREQIIFNSVMNSVDLVVDQLFGKSPERVTALNTYYSDKYEPMKNVVFYNEQYAKLRRIIRLSTIRPDRQALRKISRLPKSARALQTVALVKNSFAHCAYQFPPGSGMREAEILDPEIISVSTRLVLLSLQMLLLVKYEGSHEKIYCWWYPAAERRKIEIHAFLRTVQLIST